jgi:hypothetical protein
LAVPFLVITAPRPSIPGLSADAQEYGPARRSALRDYVLENEERFTREALTRAALDAGYEPAEVDAAFARPAGQTRLSGAWSCTALMTAGVYVGSFVLGLVLFNGLAGGQMMFGFVLLAFVGGALGAIALRDRRPEIAYGLACGVALAILVPFVVFVLFVALVGICTVIGVRFLG